MAHDMNFTQPPIAKQLTQPKNVNNELKLTQNELRLYKFAINYPSFVKHL
jgi:hypothetical protein